MMVWGAKQIPIKCLKEIFQFGNHEHCEQALNCKVDSMCHPMDANELKYLLVSLKE
jgi:hypothetical protein